MRILCDQGVHNMRNQGNNAMLQAAIARLRDYWPHATFDVITDAPHLSRLFFPDVHPVSSHTLQRICTSLDRLERIVPHPLWRLLFEAREAYWHRRAMRNAQHLQPSRQTNFSTDSPGLNTLDEHTPISPERWDKLQYQAAIREGLSNYDLLLFSGGGNLYDYDPWVIFKMFDRIEAATALGIPSVMVGQGVGVMTNADVRSRAQVVLSTVELIGVRNRRIGLSTLASLSIPAERCLFTGDDAIELAYQARSPTLGNGLGISLRVAGYTQIEQRHLVQLRSVLHEAARLHDARLIAVPISSHHDESDLTYIKQLLAGYTQVLAGWQMFDTPLNTIKRAGQCRVMIAGTYHGAIFALGQGIPVIALVKSAEYIDKLSELSDEFGLGCQVFYLEDEKLPEQLLAAIQRAWLLAEQNRSALLEVATQQIALQQIAYRRIFAFMTAREQIKNDEQPYPQN